MPSNRNVDRGRATRDHLIDVATRLFVEHGYEGTSVEAVLRESGTSRGSLYHHFAGKDALFAAVLERVGADVAARMEEAVAGTADPVAMLRTGAAVWVRLAGDPVVRRVMLIDAPAVLGWERWREMDEGQTLQRIRAALTVVADEGRLEHALVDVSAHVLVAAVDEIALVVARADDPEAAAAAGETAIGRVLDGLVG